MNKEITEESFQETIDRLKEMGIKIRGCCVRNMADSLIGTEKESLLDDIQQKARDYGLEEDLRKINVLKWYPFALNIAAIFSFYEVLGWTEEDIKTAGRNCPSSSAQLVFRTLAFSMSLEKSFKMLDHIWKSMIGVGEIESVELNTKEKYAIARIRNFPIHPFCCIFIEGFGEGFGKLLIEAEKYECKETKCPFRGDEYHEYFLTWE